MRRHQQTVVVTHRYILLFRCRRLKIQTEDEKKQSGNREPYHSCKGSCRKELAKQEVSVRLFAECERTGSFAESDLSSPAARLRPIIATNSKQPKNVYNLEPNEIMDVTSYE